MVYNVGERKVFKLCGVGVATLHNLGVGQRFSETSRSVQGNETPSVGR